MNAQTIKTREQLAAAIKNGESFTVYGRPVRIWNGNLAIEINMGRGKAYTFFTNEDLAKLNPEP